MDPEDQKINVSVLNMGKNDPFGHNGSFVNKSRHIRFVYLQPAKPQQKSYGWMLRTSHFGTMEVPRQNYAQSFFSIDYDLGEDLENQRCCDSDPHFGKNVLF